MSVGFGEGTGVGNFVGIGNGIFVGAGEGTSVGKSVGFGVGSSEGFGVVGTLLGAAVGTGIGTPEGTGVVGVSVCLYHTFVGDMVGEPSACFSKNSHLPPPSLFQAQCPSRAFTHPFLSLYFLQLPREAQCASFPGIQKQSSWSCTHSFSLSWVMHFFSELFFLSVLSSRSFITDASCELRLCGGVIES